MPASLSSQPFTLILADSLTNDFMGGGAFEQTGVHIGQRDVERLMGAGSAAGNGPLPTFLSQAVVALRQGRPIGLILVRDCHDPKDPDQLPELLRYGRHNVRGEQGAAFLPFLKPLLSAAAILETRSLSLPLKSLRRVTRRLLGQDLLTLNGEQRRLLRWVLVGCHTDKRILGTANLLRNVLEFPNVAVCPHLVGSSNHEAHLASLQVALPDALVQVFPDLRALLGFAGLAKKPFRQFDCRGAALGPPGVIQSLNADQRHILELAFLRCSQVTLQPLSGGFSGSLLWLARRQIDGVAGAPVVVKIDRHGAMQKELEGYDRVKAIFGSQVPSFGTPISSGGHTGILMELASRSGTPHTLQWLFEQAVEQRDPDQFLAPLRASLELLHQRLYRPTLRRCRFSPWQRLGLSAPQQWEWLRENIGHIAGDGWQGGPIRLTPDLVLEDFTALFQQLAADSHWLPGAHCLGHGDLNLANIILDDLANVWFIDWTHAGLLPVELDLAKLENDIKLVVSKGLAHQDLGDLLILERLLLEQRLPLPLEEAAKRLPGLASDPHLALVYQSVAAIRQRYADLHPEQDDTLYQIALLRYATHTLSFDARRGRGECSLEQLRHALGTVHLLVQQLARGDFHRLTPAVRPDSYPDRQRLPRELAPWPVPCPDYQPPFHEDPILSHSDWADPLDMDWAPPDDADPWRDSLGRPLNPRGRTGLAGRGLLGRWGANRAVDPVITRINPGNGRLELLLGRRWDTGESSLPGCMRLAGESEAQALVRCLRLKAGIALPMKAGSRVYRGPVDDFRDTDHAWIESSTWSWHLTGKAARRLYFRGGGGLGELGWTGISPELLRSLFAGHADLVRCALRWRAARREPGADQMEQLLRES